MTSGPAERTPRSYDRLKRAMDVVLGSALIVVTAPLSAAVAAVVRARLGRPVLFRQERPGRDARPFVLAKFRTMTDVRGPDGRLLGDGARLTPTGRFLRATSLDELPELVSVVRGDMSLVGPRPLLMEYVDRYNPEQMRRHEVRPGLTGWTQVNGRNALSWEDKFALDVWYVDHRSLLLDLRILLRTIPAALRARGISADGHATMRNFEGVGSSGDTHAAARSGR